MTELSRVDRISVILEQPLVLAHVFLAVMHLLFELGSFIATNEHTLLFGVLVLNLSHDSLGLLLLSSQLFLHYRFIEVFKLLRCEPFQRLSINFTLQITQQFFVVVDFLLTNLGLPLPERLHVVRLLLDFNTVTLHLLKLIAHDLDHADSRLIIRSRSSVFYSGETSREPPEAWCDFILQLCDGCHRRQVLSQVEVVFPSESLRLMDEFLHV